MNYKINENGDIIKEDGTIIPKKQRQRCEVFSRVVGYLRPVSMWNKGKKREYEERKEFEYKEVK